MAMYTPARPGDGFAAGMQLMCTQLAPTPMPSGVSVPEKQPLFLFTQRCTDERCPACKFSRALCLSSPLAPVDEAAHEKESSSGSWE